MNDEQLLRYSRHVMLPQLDLDGQEKLLASTVLILGLGGLGCPVALYLAGAGVGRLVLADDDRVDLGNLQRQIAHATSGIGRNKAESARDAVLALNPGTQVEIIQERLAGDALVRAVAGAHAVVDCTDNFTTRFALNRACVLNKVPLVSGAAIRLEGQLSVFDPRNPQSPCYHCLYEEGEDLDASCASNGVLAPLVGVIGSLQALECLKVLTGLGTPLVGRLLLFDASGLQFREMQLGRNPQCLVCGAGSNDAGPRPAPG